MRKTIFIILVFIFALLFISDIVFGSVILNVTELLSLFTDENINLIVINYRLPKALTACLSGASLALAGMMMQTFFRNPLAGPYVLGVNSGASLAVALYMLGVNLLGFQLLSNLNKYGLVLSSFIGAALALSLVVLAWRSKIKNVALLILGLMLGFIFGAIESILQYFGTSQNVKNFVVWGMGSLSNTNFNDIILFSILFFISFIFILFQSKNLNAMQIGNNYARSLGVDTKKIGYIIFIFTALLAGTTTAFCGPIAFAGVAVPIITQSVIKSNNHFKLIFGNILIGASLLLFCDIISQLPGTGYTLPINVVTSIIGAPFLIFIILKNKGLKIQ